MASHTRQANARRCASPLSRLRPLVLAIGLGAAGLASLPAAAQAVSYDIPAGSLDAALAEFGRQSGVLVSVRGELSERKTTRRLKGSHPVNEALSMLLQGTGLQAVRQDDGSYVLRSAPPAAVSAAPAAAAGATVLPAVSVVTTGYGSEAGSAEAGYRASDTAGIGPWRERSLQDTPYTITVLSSSLIENLVATDMDQYFKMNPTTQNSAPSTVYDAPYAAYRGFHQWTYVSDGLRLSVPGHGISLEEVERVEILTGLSGFLYGSGNVGGVSNYVLKRPTKEPLAKLTAGNYGGSQYYAHADLGGPIDDGGRFGYRLNVAYQDGGTEKDNQHLTKGLFSGAIDWRVRDDLLLQASYAHRDYALDGVDTRFYFTGIKRPAASRLDTDTTHTPDWSFNDTTTDRFGLNATWSLNEVFTLRTAYQLKLDERESIYTYPMMQSDGRFNLFISKTAPYEYTSHGAHVYLDADFSTGPVDHKLTVGVYGDSFKTRQHTDQTASLVPAGLTLAELSSFPEPELVVGTGDKYTASRTSNLNLVIGDDITFDDRWSALVGANRARIKAKSYATTGRVSSEYDKSAYTPTLALMFKPVPELTTYVSYMESLEQGTIVGDTYKNAGEVLEPLVSKQYEAGVKHGLGGVMLTASLFRIEKANQYSDDGTIRGTYVQDGLQVHQGLEMTAVGKASENLTLMGGATFMHARVEDSNNPSIEGKQPTTVADRMLKLYAEYAVPAVPGLTVTGGLYHTGRAWGDGANTDKLPAYTIADIGARYATRLGGYDTTFRLNIANLADKAYWATSYSLGLPRTVAFSMSMAF